MQSALHLDESITHMHMNATDSEGRNAEGGDWRANYLCILKQVRLKCGLIHSFSHACVVIETRTGNMEVCSYVGVHAILVVHSAKWRPQPIRIFN